MTGLVIGIVGSESDGIPEAGETLISAFAREGYFAFLSHGRSSQARGGEASCRLRVSTTPILSSGGVLDLAVVLNWSDFRKLEGELPVGPGTVVVGEKKRTGDLPKTLVGGQGMITVPISGLVREIEGEPKAKGCVVLGLLSVWLGLSSKSLVAFIGTRFLARGAGVDPEALKAFTAGVDYAAKNPLPSDLMLEAPLQKGNHRAVADGNEMCARAALFSGCTFFSGYPMAPATGA